MCQESLICREHLITRKSTVNICIAAHHQKHPRRLVKTLWVVCEFVHVVKIWVNLFHFCGRWVKTFWSGKLSISPLPWQWQIHPLNFIVSPTVYNQTLSSPNTVDEFIHFKAVCFLHPHYFKPNHSRHFKLNHSRNSSAVRLFYLGHHNVHTTIPHTNQTPLWHAWMGFVIYYYPCTNTHIRIKSPPHCPRWVVLWSALSVFAFTSFAPMVSFYTRNQFSPFCGRTKMRDIYRQKKKRHLPPIFTH